MAALQPLQEERPDLAYSTETVALAADAAGEADIVALAMRTAAGRKRRLGFREKREARSMRCGDGLEERWGGG